MVSFTLFALSTKGFYFIRMFRAFYLDDIQILFIYNSYSSTEMT